MKEKRKKPPFFRGRSGKSQGGSFAHQSAWELVTEQTWAVCWACGEGPLEAPGGAGLTVPPKSHGTWRGNSQRKGGAGQTKTTGVHDNSTCSQVAWRLTYAAKQPRRIKTVMHSHAQVLSQSLSGKGSDLWPKSESLAQEKDANVWKMSLQMKVIIAIV